MEFLLWKATNPKTFSVQWKEKLYGFSDLINFEPSSISTNCQEVKEKYEEYSEAMAFTQGLSNELMTETMQKY